MLEHRGSRYFAEKTGTEHPAQRSARVIGSEAEEEAGVSAGRLQRIAQILDVPVTFFFSDLGKAGGSQLSALLDSAYSLRMVKALNRIRDRQIQRNAVELVEAIADSFD